MSHDYIRHMRGDTVTDEGKAARKPGKKRTRAADKTDDDAEKRDGSSDE